MDHGETEALVRALEAALGPHLRESLPLRRLAKAAGEWLAAQAERAEGAAATDGGVGGTGADDSGVAPAAQSAAASGASGTPAVEPAPLINGPQVVTPRPTRDVPLRLGGADTSVKVFGRPEEVARVHEMVEAEEAETARTAEAEVPVAIDLGLIAERCGLKAVACRSFIRRRSTAAMSPEEDRCIEEMHGLIDTAKSMRECLLWMFFREYRHPDDDAMERIARWYDAHAAAARLMKGLDASPRLRRRDLERAMQLFAHANSGLRRVLEATWLTRPDVDQQEGHLWLRWETKVRSVLVERYMRMDDPAEPDSVEELAEKLEAFAHEIEDREKREASIEQSLRRVRYHAESLADGGSFDPGHDWERVESSLAELERAGVLPTDARVTTAIEELAEVEVDSDVPGARSGAALAALRELVEQAEAEERDEPSAKRQWSERVLEVRRLLTGRRVVVVGGEERHEAVERFVDAFGLAGVDWVTLTEHGSSAAIRAPIEREDTALVLILIKLTGHLHADEAKRYAKAAGKPFVLLKAGYNPERVALAVCNQASEQLADVR